jgi:hypothetical protein
MEYDGRWRVVQYAVQRAYAPLLVSSFTDSTSTVKTHLTSDLTTPVGGTLTISLHKWDAVNATPAKTW